MVPYGQSSNVQLVMNKGGKIQVHLNLSEISLYREFLYIHKEDFVKGLLPKVDQDFFISRLDKYLNLGLLTTDNLYTISSSLRNLRADLYNNRDRISHTPKNIIIAGMINMTIKIEFFSALPHRGWRIYDYIKSQILYGFEFNDYCADARKYSYILQCNEYSHIKGLPDKEFGKVEYTFSYDLWYVSDSDIFPPDHNLPFAPLEKDLKDIEYAMVEDPPIPLNELIKLRVFLRKVLLRYQVILQQPDDLDFVLSSKNSKTIDEVTGRSHFNAHFMKSVPKWSPLELQRGFRYTRTYIYKHSAEVRDGVNTTITQKAFLYHMNYLLLQITKPIPWCGIGKNIPRPSKEFFNIMMDITKDGHTQNREVLKIFCEELEYIYPAFPFTTFYRATMNSQTVDFNKDILFTKRGWGIGMMNCLAGFITGTIISLSGEECFVTNDDIVVYTSDTNLTMASQTYKKVCTVLRTYNRDIKEKKTTISKSLKTCEQYYFTHMYNYKVDKDLKRDFSILENIYSSPVPYLAKEQFNQAYKSYSYRSHIFWPGLKGWLIDNFHEHPYEMFMPSSAGGYDTNPNNLNWDIRIYVDTLNDFQRYWFQNHCNPPNSNNLHWKMREFKTDYFLKSEMKEEFMSNWLVSEELANFNMEKVLNQKVEGFSKNRSKRPERLLTKYKKIQDDRIQYFKKKDKTFYSVEVFTTSYVHDRPACYAIPLSWVSYSVKDEIPYVGKSWILEQGSDQYQDKLRVFARAFNIKTNMHIRDANVHNVDISANHLVGFSLWQDDRPLGLSKSESSKYNVNYANFGQSVWLNPYRDLSTAELYSRIPGFLNYTYKGPALYKDVLKNLCVLSQKTYHLKSIKRFVPVENRTTKIMSMQIPQIIKEACTYYIWHHPDRYNAIFEVLTDICSKYKLFNPWQPEGAEEIKEIGEELYKDFDMISYLQGKIYTQEHFDRIAQQQREEELQEMIDAELDQQQRDEQGDLEDAYDEDYDYDIDEDLINHYLDEGDFHQDNLPEDDEW